MGAGNDIFVTNSAVGAVVQGTGWTRLNIHRAIATGTNTYLFPLGTGANSQPVNVTCNNVTVAAQIRMQGITQTAGQLGGNSGIDGGHDVGNTWTLQIESGTIGSYDLVINFGTAYDAGSDPLRFVARRQHANTEVWSTTTFTAASTSMSITGETMTDTHFYGVGQQSIDHYVVSASSPQATGIAFDTTVTAQDVFNVTANLDGTVVTMTGNSGNAQFDSDGNGTFGDNTKSITNGTFTISTKDNVNEGLTVTATDGNNKTGTSANIDVQAKVFTGPGSFSDTSKWSGNSLPNAGANFRILNACTFDNAAPVRTYGDMLLGTGATTGALSWQVGNTVVLDIDDVIDDTAAEASAVDMTNGGTLRIGGNYLLFNDQLTGGTGTVELTGTGKTFSPGNSILNNVTITGSITLSSHFKWKGTLDVQTGASLTGQTSTFVRPESGATVTGSGTKSFYQFEVNVGTVNASGSFSVSNAFLVPAAGTFIPAASTVITGTGLTFTPNGTIKVTRNGSNALNTQYVFSSIDTTDNTTEYAGTANQFLPGGRTFKNLTVNNPVSVQLTGNITVTSLLTLTQGLVMGAGSDIFVTNSAVGAVVQGTGWTRLNIHRAIATGTNTYLFPLGTGANSQPVNVTCNNVTVAGQIRMQGITQTSGQLGGNSGIDGGHDVGNTWTLQVESGTIASYDVVINFGTQYDAGSDPLRFVARRQHANTEVWSTTTFTAAATSISITGETMTDTHFYATGQQSIDHYVVSASSPQSAGTPFTTTVTGEDVFNITANRSDTVVTMTSSTGNGQFDSDGNGTFGDNTKTLTNGSFTISTKDNTVESVTLTATDANTKTGSSGAISVNLGPASTATTTISASLSSINAGGSTSTITVQAKDAGGNNLTSSGGTVTLNTNLGALGSVTDNNNGTYTATLTSGQTAGTATITGTINAASITDTETVTFTTPPFGAPALFIATATSTSQVALSWTPVSGATSYEVWRSSLNSAYSLAGTTIGTTLNDSGLTASRTYLYKVRAMNGVTPSSFSTPDAATTVVFTDSPLVGGTTKIKAVHITELRTAVNLMRAAAGLSAATFTDSSLIAGTTQFKAVHLTELRTALNAARTAASLPALTYTDTTITANTTTGKAAHLTEIRNALQ
jgi:hypothetical protein